MRVSTQDAYKEACTVIGELTVENRLLSIRLLELDPPPQQVPVEEEE